MQSIGHHAVSGVCYVHPHLGEVCKSTARASAVIDLLNGKALLDDIEIPRPLELASRALAERFAEILCSENIESDSLTSAIVEFQFSGSRWPDSCYVKVETNDGKTLVDAVSSSGERAEIIRGLD